MMENVVTALQSITQKTVTQPQRWRWERSPSPQRCAKEQHFGEEINVTRKGAVSARVVRWSYSRFDGSKSFIVRGLGNESRSVVQPRCRWALAGPKRKNCSAWKIVRATAHVECRKDASDRPNPDGV
ncbi:hypothetical protein ACLK1S_21205 [Escherichia coli]